jgi:hypothetical protein
MIRHQAIKKGGPSQTRQEETNRQKSWSPAQPPNITKIEGIGSIKKRAKSKVAIQSIA